MKVNLHIERLVLDGLPVDQRSSQQIQAAVRAKLTELLVSSVNTPSLQHIGSQNLLRAPGITIQESASPAVIGVSVAQAIHGGLE